MIGYVDTLLKHWIQELSVEVENAGLGFPSKSPWVEMGKAVESGASLIASNPDGYVSARGTASRPGIKRFGLGKIAQRVAEAVGQLDDVHQGAVVVYYENQSLSVSGRAAMLGCSVKTMYKRINRAHNEISDLLPSAYTEFK